MVQELFYDYILSKIESNVNDYYFTKIFFEIVNICQQQFRVIYLENFSTYSSWVNSICISIQFDSMCVSEFDY